MSSVSKYFYLAVGSASCKDLLHMCHGSSCWQDWTWNLTQIISSCCKYVLPIATLPVLMKAGRGQLNWVILRDSAMKFLEYSLATWMMSSFGLCFMCLFYRIFGRLYYTTVMALPLFCSSAMCACLFSHKLISMFAHGLFVLLIEVSITRGDTFVMKTIRDSLYWRTVSFMTINLCLLNAIIRSKGSNLWFLNPLNVSVMQTHQGVCQINCPETGRTNDQSLNYLHNTQIQQELLKCLSIGLGLEALKAVAENGARIQWNPTQFAIYMYRHMRYNVTGFLVIYTGLYRMLSYWLSYQTSYLSSNVAQSVASFLSGIAFSIYPNPSLFAHALAITVQLNWAIYTENTPVTFAMNLAKRLPIARIFYPITFAYLTHTRVFYPWLAPAVLKKLMNLSTNYKDNHIMTKYHEYLFGG